MIDSLLSFTRLAANRASGPLDFAGVDVFEDDKRGTPVQTWIGDWTVLLRGIVLAAVLLLLLA